MYTKSNLIVTINKQFRQREALQNHQAKLNIIFDKQQVLWI